MHNEADGRMQNEFIDHETGELIRLGLRTDMTNEQYHAGPGTSKSHLSYLMECKSLRKYWHKYRAPADQRIVEDEKRSLIVGSATHCATLQPDLFPAIYIKNPGIDRRTKEGKADWAYFLHDNPGKIVLDEKEWTQCLGMRDSVWRDPVARGLLAGCHTEQIIYAIDPETGELVKCQYDALHMSGSHACDLKTCDDASDAAFGRDCAKFYYDWQPPWYADVADAGLGWHPRDWVFIAVEKAFPYEVAIYHASPEQIECGRIAAREQFARIVEAKRANYWPGLSEEVRPLQLPSWRR